MNRYLCKCGRAVNKSTNADNTGNRETEGCEGCPYLMPWGEQKYNHDTKHFYLDIKGYECRMSQTLEYETRFGGSVTDRCTCYIASLDFDFLERVSAWIKEHYPDGQISGTFSRETIRAVEYVSNGRYRLSISCAQNKAGIAAKAALFNAFFDESGRRFDMDADAEKAKILRDIERGKAAAHSVAAAPDKETKTMLIYRDPATGWLYRVSPQPENGIYAMQYRDPANSVVWKPDITWNTNAVYRDREHLQEGLEARAKRDGWELVSGPASSEPPEVVDEGEEYSPCDTCRCPDCIDSSCPQAGCDKTDGGFGCFAPYEECPAPAEKTWPDEHLVKDKISDCFGAWCGSIGIHRKAAERLLQVSKLLDNSTPREQKVLEELTPSVLYEASRPSAEPEAVEALKSKQVKTLKEFRALEAQIKAEREAREKAVAEAESLRYANDALRDEAATARAQAKHAQEKADALETRPVMSELFDAKERIKELEARPVEVAVQEPDPAEVERRAGEKAREMTAMLQAQVRGMQEDLDDARKIIDSAESATYMAAAEFAVNAAQVLNGIRASFWAVAKELSDEDFSSAAAPLLEAANRIVDCEWDDDEEEQE